jgi:hypothetical protein
LPPTFDRPLELAQCHGLTALAKERRIHAIQDFTDSQSDDVEVRSKCVEEPVEGESGQVGREEHRRDVQRLKVGRRPAIQ